eukprot:380309_1
MGNETSSEPQQQHPTSTETETKHEDKRFDWNTINLLSLDEHNCIKYLPEPFNMLKALALNQDPTSLLDQDTKIFYENFPMRDLYPFKYNIYYDKNRDSMHMTEEKDEVYGHGVINVTFTFLKYMRKKWFTDMVFENENGEFNIFRSLCFSVVIPDKQCNFDILGCGNIEKQMKLTLSFLVTILQSLLITSIIWDLSNSFQFKQIYKIYDVYLLILSIVVFSVISYLTSTTIKNYIHFYRYIGYVCQVSWGIIILDFISNVIIGALVSGVSLFFLLSSETLTDAALNSFALTFILELDDIVNLFNKDINYLIKQDFKYAKYNKEKFRFKRKIEMYDEETCTQFIYPILRVILAPFHIIYVFILLGQSIYETFIRRKHRDHKSVSPAPRPTVNWGTFIENVCVIL